MPKALTRASRSIAVRPVRGASRIRLPLRTLASLFDPRCMDRRYYPGDVDESGAAERLLDTTAGMSWVWRRAARGRP